MMFTSTVVSGFIVALLTSSSIVGASPTSTLSPQQVRRALSAHKSARGDPNDACGKPEEPKPEEPTGNACYPNFFGEGVSITNYGGQPLEWGVTPAATNGAVLGSSSFRGFEKPDWHVQQDGKYPTHYIIKDVDNNNLAVEFESSWTNLDLGTASDSGNDINQLFEIACLNCYPQGPAGSILADYCLISPLSTNAAGCVEMTPGNPLSVGSCDTINEYQIFRFVS